LETDPSSFIAQQELRRTQQMMNEAANPQPQAMVMTPLRRRLENAQGPVELAPLSNVPITLKVTEKANVIYETVGKLAGMNVLFDPITPRSKSRRIEQRHPGRSALHHLFETKTFWRPVTSNTIFVAADTPAKRKELEQTYQDFLSSNLSQPPSCKTCQRHAHHPRGQPHPATASQGAIVVRGTPDQVALAQKLVDDLDKAKPEVLIEVMVMQVSRDKSTPSASSSHQRQRCPPAQYRQHHYPTTTTARPRLLVQPRMASASIRSPP